MSSGIRRVRIDYVRYKPGQSCVVRYVVHHEDGTEHVCHARVCRPETYEQASAKAGPDDAPSAASSADESKNTGDGDGDDVPVSEDDDPNATRVIKRHRKKWKPRSYKPEAETDDADGEEMDFADLDVERFIRRCTPTPPGVGRRCWRRSCGDI